MVNRGQLLIHQTLLAKELAKLSNQETTHIARAVVHANQLCRLLPCQVGHSDIELILGNLS